MRRGFTLLEMLVATTIMGIAVVTILASLSTSMRNAAKLTDSDRVAMLARQKMDEILLDTRFPHQQRIEGQWDAAFTGGRPAGWAAFVSPFEFYPGARPGQEGLFRVQVEVWLGDPPNRRVMALEGYRKGMLLPQDLPREAVME